ncbi:MAG: hypothetical protein JW726_10320 [Anaerolineales bacterium]|nr:hypothetical protein [Anaerolineales bacterium]
MYKTGQYFLRIGGLLNIAIAILHLVVIFIGALAYRYFDAGEQMAVWAETGSPIPAVVTLGLSVIFVICALYAFSAAGNFRKLPFLRLGVLLIGAIYTLRGLLFIPAALVSLADPALQLSKEMTFSAVAFIVGILYLIGSALCLVLHKAGQAEEGALRP